MPIDWFLSLRLRIPRRQSLAGVFDGRGAGTSPIFRLPPPWRFDRLGMAAWQASTLSQTFYVTATTVGMQAFSADSRGEIGTRPR
jgi:hypothetical protein